MGKNHRFCVILNTDGRHLDKVSWQKAMTLLTHTKQSVFPIEFHDDYIKGADGESYRLPKSLMVKKYVKHTPRYTPSRRNIFLRDEYTCRYCGKELGSDELTLDHILPRSKGGRNTWENLACACFPCNSRKGDKLLSELTDMKLLPCPNEERW